MPFSEQVKKQVRRKAAFRCCGCQDLDVQVHHVIPETDDGPNTFADEAGTVIISGGPRPAGRADGAKRGTTNITAPVFPLDVGLALLLLTGFLSLTQSATGN